MRLYLLFFLCVFALMGCVYYGDIHSNSKQLDSSSLSSRNSYKVPLKTSHGCCWWEKFNDPQLNQLIAIALADSPTMQIAEARVRQTRHLAEGAASTLWPSVDLSGYLQKERFSETGIVPPPFNGKTFNIGELGLNFNYEFDFWGRNRQALAARLSEAYAFQADLAEARLILASAVANVYFQLLGNNEQLRIMKSNLQQKKEISDIVVDRAQNGVESDIPVKSALANLQEAKLLIEQYKQAGMTSRHQLAILLGKNPFVTEIKTHQFSYHHYRLKLPASLTANILAQRPDISAAKARAQAAAHRINVAKAGFFPDINLNALLSFQSIQLNKLFKSENQNNAITGAIDLPIFDAGARRANLGVKYAEYDLAVNEYNNTILTALREVADQISIMQSLKSQLISQNDALKANQHNYKLFTSRYKHGIVDYVQVLEIKELLLQQQSTLVKLQIQDLQAIVTMLKALGGTQG